MTSTASQKSLVLHSAARHYDRLAWLLTLGREHALRERLVELARLEPGEVVIDVGCGTGSLAIAAKRVVGPTGAVRGIDASSEMIEQARAKSARERMDITWDVGRAEALPCPDASVDVLLSTLMMHHLPRAIREAFAGEIHRVLKPGGRVLVVDFEPPAKRRGGLISRLHRHGHVPAHEIVETLRRANLQPMELGSVGASDLHYALATASPVADHVGAPTPPYRTLPGIPLPRSIWAAAVILVAVIGHAVLLTIVWPAIALGSLGALLVIAVILAHGGMVGGVHTMLRKHQRRH